MGDVIPESSPPSKPPNSRIREYAEETNHELVLNNFSVLSKFYEFDKKSSLIAFSEINAGPYVTQR